MTNLSGNPRSNSPGTADGPESAAAQLVGRARVMMIISGLTTALAVAAVVTVIGYRMFAGAGIGAISADGIVTLPKGAHVISSAASAGRIAVLMEIDGASELRTFDIKTLKPTGRIRFANEP
jgi:hypothetical protein